MEELRVYNTDKKIISKEDIYTIFAKNKKDFYNKVEQLGLKNWGLWAIHQHHKWFV